MEPARRIAVSADVCAGTYPDVIAELHYGCDIIVRQPERSIRIGMESGPPSVPIKQAAFIRSYPQTAVPVFEYMPDIHSAGPFFRMEAVRIPVIDTQPVGSAYPQPASGVLEYVRHAGIAQTCTVAGNMAI